MATIQIKRGLQSALESVTLKPGELAVALDTGNVYIGTNTGNSQINGGAASSAAKLATARQFSITGDGTAEAVSFDGTGNVALNLVLATLSGLTAGTYTKVTVNEKGQVTGGDTIEVSDLPTIPTSKISGLGTAATKNTGSAAGNVVEVQTGGTILSSLIPDLGGTYVKTSTTINGKTLTGNVTLNADDVGAIPAAQKGAASGVAELDETGKVPSTQLPSYVDDVVEGYYNDGSFYEESGHTTEITGEAGKIYVDMTTNKTYRWSGSAYVEISASLALGTTSSTAFRGDQGNAAYQHSQITSGNPHGTTADDVGAAPSSHTSVVASASALGHVKVGTGLNVGSDGTLSLGDIDGGTF